MMPLLPIIPVASVVLIDTDQRLLISTRPQGKTMQDLWEFPGGKIEEGETPEQTAVRELEEELSLSTATSCLLPLTFNSYAYDDFHLLIYLFTCRRWDGLLHPNEGQQTQWVFSHELRHYTMPEANKHLCAMLRDYL